MYPVPNDIHATHLNSPVDVDVHGIDDVRQAPDPVQGGRNHEGNVLCSLEFGKHLQNRAGFTSRLCIMCRHILLTWFPECTDTHAAINDPCLTGGAATSLTSPIYEPYQGPASA
jgi:hypothetical protein